MFNLPSTLALRRTGAAVLLATGLCAAMGTAQAQTELPAAQAAAIRQKLAQRMPDMPPATAVRATPVAGLFEVQAGGNLLYVDAKAEYAIEGHIIDLRNQRNLTEERLDEINKIDMANLPLKDAVVWKSGTGKRKLVVFSDPNCGYCKRLEREFQQVKDVTIYTFMIGILGDDSKAKADNIWCVKDRTQAWLDWMLAGKTPAKAFGMCATPLQRNMAMAQRLRVNGTPAMFFEDGTRLASAVQLDTIEQRLAKATAKAAE